MPIITANIQGAVDEYISLHQTAKELEARMKQLRAIIEPFMEQNQLEQLLGTQAGAVAHQASQRPVMSAKYTSFEPAQIDGFLTEEIRERVYVPRVDKDMLEAVVKLGQVSEEVLKLKIVNQSRSFVVKR